MSIYVRTLPIDQVTEQEIDYVPVERRQMTAMVITSVYDDVVEYMNNHPSKDFNDFVESAFQRELDFRNGVKRVKIADLMSKMDD